MVKILIIYILNKYLIYDGILQNSIVVSDQFLLNNINDSNDCYKSDIQSILK